MFFRQRFAGTIAVFCLVTASCAANASDKLDATKRFSGDIIEFVLNQPYSNVQLTVAGPGGYYATEATGSASPSLRLSDHLAGDSRLRDGLYKFQITAATDKEVPVENRLNNGRGDAERKTKRVSASASGTFRVKNEQILELKDLKE